MQPRLSKVNQAALFQAKNLAVVFIIKTVQKIVICVNRQKLQYVSINLRLVLTRHNTLVSGLRC